MITIKELLTTYWSQLTLLLIGLSYLVQRALNLKSKKLEINHSLFQQKRLDSVNEFYLNYAKTEQMWIHLSIYDILNDRLSAKEIDYIIFPTINELQKNVYQLQIYFDRDEHNFFEQIMQNIKNINSSLMRIYFDVDQNSSSILKSTSFTSIRDENLAKNEEIIRKVSQTVRRTFN